MFSVTTLMLVRKFLTFYNIGECPVSFMWTSKLVYYYISTPVLRISVEVPKILIQQRPQQPNLMLALNCWSPRLPTLYFENQEIILESYWIEKKKKKIVASVGEKIKKLQSNLLIISIANCLSEKISRRTQKTVF